jgi:hypothetical protein
VTDGPDNPIEIATAAACTVGLDATGAQLLSHSTNAVVLLPEIPAVARVTTGAGSYDRVTRMQTLTRLLVDQGYPATEPQSGADVVTDVGPAAVSFWVYYPPAPDAPQLGSSQLGRLLRQLHDLDDVPVDLPAWIPMESLAAAINDPQQSRALGEQDRAWLLQRISEIRNQIAALDWPLGHGLIHGDAWAGNLIWATTPVGHAILGDWDWASHGPREVDLIPTWHATVRYGRPPDWADAFVEQYGYDLASWAGYDVMLQMRDLVQLTGPLRRAPHSRPAQCRLAQRLGDLQRGDRTNNWQARS